MALPSRPATSSKCGQRAGRPWQERAFLPEEMGSKSKAGEAGSASETAGAGGTDRRSGHRGKEEVEFRPMCFQSERTSPVGLRRKGRRERAAAPALPCVATRCQQRAARRSAAATGAARAEGAGRKHRLCFPTPSSGHFPPNDGPRGRGRRTLDKGSGQESVPPGPQEAEAKGSQGSREGSACPPRADASRPHGARTGVKRLSCVG